jgi:aminopeptidase N
VHSGVASLAGNSTARGEVWNWLKANWDHVHGRLAGNSVVLARFVKCALNHFADHAVERDIAQFFADRDTQGFDKNLAQVSDAIKRNANYRERDEKLILEWLKTKGFA